MNLLLRTELRVVLNLACFALGFFLLAFDKASAQEVDTERAMQSVGSPSWYDRSEDSYAKPTIRELDDNSIRTEGRKAAFKPPNARWRFWDWFDGNGQRWNWGLTGLSSDLFSALIIGLLAVLIATVLILLGIHSFKNYMPGAFEKKTPTTKIEIDPAKVADLPFEVKRESYDNPLQEAEALMKAGKFRDAIIFLYGYQLLALDQERKIELERGKTNRMYLRELNRIPALKAIQEQTMLAFEDAYFGHHPVSEERFMACWQQLPEFHRLATSVVGRDHSPLRAEVQPA